MATILAATTESFAAAEWAKEILIGLTTSAIWAGLALFLAKRWWERKWRLPRAYGYAELLESVAKLLTNCLPRPPKLRGIRWLSFDGVIANTPEFEELPDFSAKIEEDARMFSVNPEIPPFGTYNDGIREFRAESDAILERFSGMFEPNLIYTVLKWRKESELVLGLIKFHDGLNDFSDTSAAISQNLRTAREIWRLLRGLASEDVDFYQHYGLRLREREEHEHLRSPNSNS